VAVREFDGIDDYIETATGALATSTFGTFAALVKRGGTGAWHTFLAFHDSGGTALNQFAYESSDLTALWSAGTTRTGPAAIGTADWGLVVVRKTSGTATARFSLYNFTTAAWVHGNASGTNVDWTSPGTGGTVRTRWQTGDLLRGRLAVRGAWNTVKWAADTTGDAAIEAAGLETSLQNWHDATPDAGWAFNQDSVTTAVEDWTGGGANQSSLTGTTVVTGDDPPGFSFDLGTPLGTTTETDTARALTRSKTISLAATAETDTARPVGRVKTRPLGRALDTSTAHGLTRSKTAGLGRGAETDTARPLGSTGAVVLGRAAETDLARGLGRAKTRQLGRATETSLARPIEAVRVVALGRAVETDAAPALRRAKTLLLGRAVETDTARAVTNPATLVGWPPAAGAPTVATPVTAGAPTVTRGAGAGAPVVHQAVSAGEPTVS
jgi:hypothetical protein